MTATFPAPSRAAQIDAVAGAIQQCLYGDDRKFEGDYIKPLVTMNWAKMQHCAEAAIATLERLAADTGRET